MRKKDNKILKFSDIINICREGNGQKIILEASNFYYELDENLFNLKKEKISYQNLKLSDLSLYYLEYFTSIEGNDKDFKFDYSEERKNFYENINKKLKTSNKKPIDLYGPFGIGKSTSLLAFQKSEINMRSAYFNLNALFNLKDKDNLISLILYESMTLCNNFSEFQNLKNDIEKKNYDNIWDILKQIINNISSITKWKFLIMLDQYRDTFEGINIKSSSQLDDIFINDKILVLKCSSMNDNDVKENFVKNIGTDNYIYINKLCEITEINEKEKLFFGKILLFHYSFKKSKKNFLEYIEDEKKNIKNDIKNIIPDSLNLINMISKLSNLIKYSIKYEQYSLKGNILIFPMKYIIINTIEENNIKYYTFDYPCLLIRIIFEELAIELWKKTNNKTNLQNELFDGIFEAVCHQEIINKKLTIFDLYLDNLFYLDINIFSKNEENILNKKYLENMKLLDSFYIRPSGSLDLFDSIIIFKKEDKYNAYLLHIRQKLKNAKSRTDIMKSIKIVEEKLKTVYEIELDNAYFSYLLNYDELKVDDIIQLCQLKIDFFFYSMKSAKFLQVNDNKKKENKKLNSNEFINTYSFKKMEINFLSEMNDKKFSSNSINHQIYDEKKKYIIKLLSKKIINEKAESNIIGNLEPIKKIIGKKKNIILEIYEQNCEAFKILHAYNKGKYFCVLRDKEKISYGIYMENIYIFKENQFIILIHDKDKGNITKKIFFDEEAFETEIFTFV